MCDEEEFDEESSNLVLGPDPHAALDLLLQQAAARPRDLGLRPARGAAASRCSARSTGSARASTACDAARIGSSRAITQLILNLVEGSPIQLIDGGAQRRCFTDVTDGVECLLRIIDNPGGACDGAILNIGNPDNECSIRELAEMLVAKFEAHPLRGHFPPLAGFREIESRSYYGAGYQDVTHRRPSIRNARRLVGWKPRVTLEESVERTLDYFLRDLVGSEEFCQT